MAELALAEDGIRDVTSECTVAADATATSSIEAREPLVMAAAGYADAVVAAVGLSPIDWQVTDGGQITEPRVIGTITGSLRATLRAERPLLNLLQRATGIASLTARMVELMAGTGCKLLHTRKTTPGLRLFEVGAVLAGGGALHRLDLATTMMVKDNHWRALESSGRTLAEALDEARSLGVIGLHVEVESIEQLTAACSAGATRLLVDNRPPGVVAEWVALARKLSPEIELEATGGITLDTVREYALTGVDFVSTGALTHSVVSADVGLEVM